MAVLLAGLPTSVPGRDRQPALRLGPGGRDAGEPRDRDRRRVAVLAGGVESMSRAPWVLPKPERAYPRGHETLHSTTLGWRMVNPRMPEQWTISLGESAEMLAGTLRHHPRGAGRVRGPQPPARRGGVGRRASTTTRSCRCRRRRRARARRGHPPRHARSRRWRKLKPAFRTDGTVTAGNASPLNDGAGALLLGDAAGAAAAGLEPLARIAGRGTFAVDPDVFGIAPVEAANRALRARRHRLGRPRGRRAQRGVRRAVARLPRRVARARPRAAQRQRRRDRDRPPARRVRRAHPRHARARAAPPRRRLGARGDLHRRRPGPRGGARGDEPRDRDRTTLATRRWTRPDYSSTRAAPPLAAAAR